MYCSTIPVSSGLKKVLPLLCSLICTFSRITPVEANPTPIGMMDEGFVVTYTADTLKESFPAVFSSLFISLGTIPTDTVKIIVDPDDQLNIAGTAGLSDTLLFTPFPMALTPQEIKVKPVNDAEYEGWHFGNITFTVITDDAIYATFTIDPLSYQIEDDELPAGINTIFVTDTTLHEGLAGVDMLFAMNSIPADTVYVTLDPDDQLRITGVPGEAVILVFPPDASSLNYDGASVRAVDDAIYEGLHSGAVTFTVTSTDPDYASIIIDPLVYAIADNDAAPGITTLFVLDTVLHEGMTGVDLLFAMNSIPADSVYVTIDPDVQLRLTGIPGEPLTVVFPPNASALNYNGASVRAVDDVVFEGPHSGDITFSISSADPLYNVFTIDPISYAIADNDNAPGLNVVVPPVLIVTEGTGDIISIAIALNSVPADTVKIVVTPDPELRIAAPGEPITLVFPPNTSALNDHFANVKPNDDAIHEVTEVGVVTFDVITDDIDYAAFTIEDVEIIIFDNDLEPGIYFSDTSGYAGAEGDSLWVRSFYVSFESIPQSTITMTVDPDLDLDLGKGPGDAVKLKFREDSAMINKLVSVYITDDYEYEGGLHIGTIEFILDGDDTAYTNMTIPDLHVLITDNDEPNNIATFDPATFNVFPSPVSAMMHYTAKCAGKLVIADVQGIIHYMEDVQAGNGVVDVSSWPAGQYLVLLQSANTWYQFAVIKQ